MKSIYFSTFIRFGGLSQMNQGNRYGSGTFHSPPKKKGIYAFPQGVVDTFLLTATNDPRNTSNKSYWLKDENGNRITSKDFYTNESDEKNMDYKVQKEYIKLIHKKRIKIKNIFSVMGDDNNVADNDGVKWYMCVYKKPKIFKYNGEIWCHLGKHLTPDKIIEENGTWVKVDMEDYLFAIKKEKHTLKRDMMKTFSVNWKDVNPFKIYCKDHLEVFIEKIN